MNEKINSLEKYLAFAEKISAIIGKPLNYTNPAITEFFDLLGGEPNEDNFWAWREFIRSNEDQRFSAFISHFYKPTVVQYESWLNPLHFLHVSPSDPLMVAYTPSPEKGRQDVQVKTTLGRYLQKYYSNTLSNEDIKRFSDEHRGEVESQEVHFAVTPEECVDVYMNGPSSCMDGAHQSTYMPYTRGIHPAYVYGGPSLAVAYTKRNGKINARCVVRIDCNPPRYSRIYGDSLLEDKLQKLGFQEGGFAGAKLLKIPATDEKQYIVPYLDPQGDAVYTRVVGEYIELCTSSNTLGQSSYGACQVEDTSTWIRCAECGELTDPHLLSTVHEKGAVCRRCVCSYQTAYIAVNVAALVHSSNIRRVDSVNYLDTPENLTAHGFVQWRDGEWAGKHELVRHYKTQALHSQRHESFIRFATGDDGISIGCPAVDMRRNWPVYGSWYSCYIAPPHHKNQDKYLGTFAEIVAELSKNNNSRLLFSNVFENVRNYQGGIMNTVLQRFEAVQNNETREAA